MTIYIYKHDKDFQNGIFNYIAEHEAETNDECEAWAGENYPNTDDYAWSYLDFHSWG